MTDERTPHLPSAALPSAVRTYLPPRPVGAPLVTVHGRSRRAGDLFRTFLPTAMKQERTLVSPLFGSADYPRYQRLEGALGPFAAAAALTETLDDLSRQHAVDTRTIDLVGYSGGAQFAHRFALLHPERIRRLVVVASGWYTRLDARRRFPHGLGGASADAPAHFDVDAFLRLPILVIVGEHDTVDDASLRTSPRLEREQGGNRLQRALSWVDHLEEEGRRRGISTSISFDVLADCGHSFGDAVAAGFADRAMSFFGAERPDVIYLPSDVVERDA